VRPYYRIHATSESTHGIREHARSGRPPSARSTDRHTPACAGRSGRDHSPELWPDVRPEW